MRRQSCPSLERTGVERNEAALTQLRRDAPEVAPTTRRRRLVSEVQCRSARSRSSPGRLVSASSCHQHRCRSGSATATDAVNTHFCNSCCSQSSHTRYGDDWNWKVYIKHLKCGSLNFHSTLKLTFNDVIRYLKSVQHAPLNQFQPVN